MDKIRVLHSFPSRFKVFKKYCELTFAQENFESTYVDTLSEAGQIDGKFDAVFVHYLRNEDITYLSKYPISTPKILFAWGADLFNLGKFYNHFLLQKTKRLRTRFYSTYSFYTRIKKITHTIFPFLLDVRKKTKARLKVLNSFDYIVPVMPGDYHLVSEKYGLKPELHHINYVNPEIVAKVKRIKLGKNVLLGNNSSYTNNHIEAIDQLVDIDLLDRKVIIPLSYGHDDLADFVSNYAKQKLGAERVIALREYLPLNEYAKIIESCEIIIMNHMRQQAVGNIVHALLLGSHVYLRSESTVYDFLKKNKFHVNEFSNAKELIPLSNEQIEFNQIRCQEIFGKEIQHKKLSLLIAKILKPGYAVSNENDFNN